MTQDEMDREPYDDFENDDDDVLINAQRSRQKALQQKYTESGVTVGDLEALFQMCAGLQAHIRNKMASGRHFALINKKLFDEVTEDVKAIWESVYGEKP